MFLPLLFHDAENVRTQAEISVIQVCWAVQEGDLFLLLGSSPLLFVWAKSCVVRNFVSVIRHSEAMTETTALLCWLVWTGTFTIRPNVCITHCDLVIGNLAMTVHVVRVKVEDLKFIKLVLPNWLGNLISSYLLLLIPKTVESCLAGWPVNLLGVLPFLPLWRAILILLSNLCPSLLQMIVVSGLDNFNHCLLYKTILVLKWSALVLLLCWHDMRLTHHRLVR